jgi:hypothetical protein
VELGMNETIRNKKDVKLKDFSKWKKWADIKNIKYPGVYCIAKLIKNIDGEKFSWIREIVYIGMTNSQGGLQSRLNQFHNTINGGKGHGGAERFKYKYPNEHGKNLYVSVNAFKCNVKKKSVDDLKIMGKVAEYEYVCFAKYMEKFKQLPEFNDQKRSPKKDK